MSQVKIIKKLKYIKVPFENKSYCIMYDIDFDSGSNLYANMYNVIYYLPLKLYEITYNIKTWMRLRKDT